MPGRISLSALSLASLVSVVVAVALGFSLPSHASADTWNVLNDPISPGQLTEMPFGTRSYWLQPWRSSLTTQPATSLQNALGINFNVTAQEAPATAQLLHASGVTRARLEIGWGAMSYSDPSQLADPAEWTTYLTAMRDNGIRPLILLNSNDEVPVPMKALYLTLTAPAAQGATTVSLDAASAAQVVPGYTGINEDSVAAKVLITSVNADDVATLSQPLPASLGTGQVLASTLKYEPFAPPTLADGSPNPRFEQTLSGWLTYVQGVTDFVKQVYGSDNFDVEVWNELSFGSDFLTESDYFSPVPDPGSTGNVTTSLLQATVQLLQDPANGLTGVQIGDGFSNQTPFVSGTTVPPGTAAIDKHPYVGPVDVYPGATTETALPLDALGHAAYTTTTSSTDALSATDTIQDIFTPTYTALFPEAPLTGVYTETLMRDLSPIQTTFAGAPHGNATHPPGSSAPTMWITEDGMSTSEATANDMPAADLAEFQAKASLRQYVAYASEGARAIDLYAAKGAGFGLIPQAFFNAVDASPTSDPASLGGATMQAVGRLSSTLAGAQPIAQPRQLTLDAIAQDGDDSQFVGTGTTAFPTLYNRDVLAFFPFQVSQNEFVAAVYVMTSDLTHEYTTDPAPGQTPYDLPPEEYQLTIGNVDGADATVSLYDPLTGTQEPAAIVSRTDSEIVVQAAATDSPRMLTINDGPAGGTTSPAPGPASGTAPTAASGTAPTVAPGAAPTAAPATAPTSGSTAPATTISSVTSTAGLKAVTRDVLSLKTPAKMTAAAAVAHGIRLQVVCRRACGVNLMASASSVHAPLASGYGHRIIHLQAARPIRVTFRLDSRARAWLRTRKTRRLRITARDGFGTTVSKVIYLTPPHRRHRR